MLDDFIHHGTPVLFWTVIFLIFLSLTVGVIGLAVTHIRQWRRDRRA
jgi:hypothetical protein